MGDSVTSSLTGVRFDGAATLTAGLAYADAGALKRAHELEAMGALQIGLALSEQIVWTGGFAVVK
ncbi:hypothetical protein [Actinomyces sp.]|uniref:hypothetical protein n=1 Tax=Actinomyces sp. TaxID=29317 RepID=UPI0026DC2219|nr:hypothetical protein [Actinomyces sp.]MDO4900028.1 hypothetical protein [Actinomyces sp.]